MKSITLRLMTLAIAGGLLLGFSSKVHAGPASGSLLIEAYGDLEKADHDYKGHRADAMKQIEAAAREIGVNVRGNGRGHEKQGVSDAQLRAAQGLLEDARGGLKGKALGHVNNAIKQISVALKIK